MALFLRTYLKQNIRKQYKIQKINTIIKKRKSDIKKQ